MPGCKPLRSDPSLQAEFASSQLFRDSGLPELPEAWLQRSGARATWVTARVVGFLVLLLAAAPLLADLSPWASLGLFPLLGVAVHKLTILMHECCHYSLFPTRAWNERVGRWGGYLTGADFHVYGRDHMRHHRHNGTERDPQLRPVALLHGVSARERLIYVMRPLLGLTLLDVVRTYASGRPDVGPGRNVGPGGEVGPGPEQLPPERSPMSRPRFLGGVLVAQAALALVVTGFGHHPFLVLLFPISAAFAGLFLSRFRGYCEHISSPDWPDARFTRTHRLGLLEGFFFQGLGMNYHLEHHLYPNIPCYQLPRVHELYSQGLHSDRTCSTSMLGTLFRSLCEARDRTPMS